MLIAASVTKMITTAAVIDKTERSNDRDLDEKMVDFLPERWRPEVHVRGSRGYSNESFSIFRYMGRLFRSGRWDEIANPGTKFEPAAVRAVAFA